VIAEEDYDFVFLFSDHIVPTSAVNGITEVVTNHPVPGGSDAVKIALAGFRTTGRVKSAIGIPYYPSYLPPLAHEILHYWANDLDPRFGFGRGRDQDYPAHWGYASVNGQLGGFDGSTLRCESPAGAMPPACDAASAGRYRYVVSTFGQYANGFKRTPYSPLELYLMGLVPASEVDSSFLLLRDAEMPDGIDTTKPTVVVEASGVDTLPFSDITARHGVVPELPPNQRAFSAAFVVVSAEPAADSVLDEIAKLAAMFGGRAPAYDVWPSFADLTGGRATLRTTLGARRDDAHPAPPPRPALACDVLAQDCPDDLGCYVNPPTLCALAGAAKVNEHCVDALGCEPGLGCIGPVGSPDDYVCRPYCDWRDADATKACETLCPGAYLSFADDQNNVVAALCFPE